MENDYKNSDAYKAVRVIWAFGLVILMLMQGWFFGEKYNRRTADELVKINNVQTFDAVESKRKADECITAGGLPRYSGDQFWTCNKK